jgi:ubiquinone/menaquinone biosynthesis C-methylase UbiE
MATVFMKWLETSPKDYDRGIRLITLGQIERLRKKITANYVHPGQRVLDLGCGTGALTGMMAAKGAYVSAVDASPQMLAEAEKVAEQQGLIYRVEFFHLDAAMIEEAFDPQSFDLIICSMLFGDLTPEMQQYLMHTFPNLLKPNGKVIVIEESPPKNWAARVVYRVVRLAVMVLTWLLTRQIFSQPLVDFQAMFASSGYSSQENSSAILGSLVLFEAAPHEEGLLPIQTVKTLSYRPSIKNLFKDLYALFFRMFPPYPKVRPGLYSVGGPDGDSPVLVTGNFDLTVRRLVKAIDSRVDCWLLVVNSGGINVWCASGGGFLTAEKVIGAVKTSRLAQIVTHKSLILPQLAACGVDGWKVRKMTGWRLAWGPVRAEDIPTYLAADRQATEEMRQVKFPLLDRLEMLITVLSFYALLILLPVFIFWRDIFWPTTIAMVCIGIFYAVTQPYLPGKDGLVKSIPLTIIVLTGYLGYLLLNPGMPIESIFNWCIGLVGLSVFTAGEMQGTSPLMRGEQANWIAESLIALVLLAIYFLVPFILGWS